jgi:hypothetical protein
LLFLCFTPSTKAISQDTRGIELFGNMGGFCAKGLSVITFGENTVTGCSVSLKLSDIAGSACLTLRDQILGLIQGNQNLTHVGIYGDSLYSNIEDWVPLLSQHPISNLVSILQTKDDH